MKTTRLFSLQLSDYDAGFGPRLKRRRSRWRYLKLLIFVPALIIFIFPSFKIARPVFQVPSFDIPKILTSGDLFTLPAREEILNPVANGKPMLEVDRKDPLLLAAVPDKPFFQISFMFDHKSKKKKKLNLHWPSFKHPLYHFFSKNIEVKNPGVPAAVAVPMNENGKLNFHRRDGTAELACWKQPVLKPASLSQAYRRRHGVIKSRLKMDTVGAIGPGQVVYAGAAGGTLGSTGQTLVVYHGSGLYTRYTGLHETSVRKGDHIKIGQEIAVVAAANAKSALTVRWSAFLEGQEINSQSLLDLSSRLCDSK